MDRAPIALFTYNRPGHTRKTIKALQANHQANASDLFIYSDGPANEQEEEKIYRLRSYLREIKGFKSVQWVEREENLGLAKSIINGVSELMEKYGKAIILEDDIVTSPYFLSYMNDALNYYEDQREVWHISGWSYPISTEGLDETFLWRAMNCWGWASWKDRWQHFEKNPQDLIQKFDKKTQFDFNVDGVFDFWEQIEANARGEMNTWAIFWYAIIFKNRGLCLNPTQSYVINIGTDGSGEHGNDLKGLFNSELAQKEVDEFAIPLEENQLAVERIKNFMKANRRSLPERMVRKLSKLIFGKA